ncbi:MAG: hypothetical protein AAF791_05765 [Bacteroidota bacterium]
MDTNEAAPTPDTVVPRGRKRSPAYPRILLQACLAYAGTLEESNAHAYDIPYPGVAKLLGLGTSIKSDRFRSVISSLRYFGLAKSKDTETGKVLRLTDVGHKIASDRRIESEERDGLIRRAALRPKVYRALWDEWQSKGMAPEDVLVHQLEHDYGFNRNSIQSFMEGFRANLEFAGYRLGDRQPEPETVAEDEAEDADRQADLGLDVAPPKKSEETPPAPEPPSPETRERLIRAVPLGLIDFPIILDAANRAHVQVPDDLTEAGFALLDHGLSTLLDHLAIRHGFERRS